MKRTCKILLLFLSLMLHTQNTEAKILDSSVNPKKGVLDIYIYDKSGSEIASGKGFVIDSDGIIATNCRLISKWLEDNVKGESAEEHFHLGLKYEAEKKYDEAEYAYKKAIKLKPDYLEAYINLGNIFYKLSKYPEALDAYRKALSINEDYKIYNKLGTIYIITGKYSMAIDAFNRALKVNSESPETYFNLGVSYYLNGDKDKAHEKYIILNKLDKVHAENLFELLYR